MKSKSIALVVAAFAALCLSQNVQAGSISNRAVLSAPRSIEESPWLARAAFPARPAGSRDVRLIDALPASPRSIEQYPGLFRIGFPERVPSEFRTTVQDFARPISPRAIEEFPALRWVTSATAVKRIKA